MKLAANISLMFNDLPMQQRIQHAAALGFQGIEIQFPYVLTVDEWQQQLAKTQLPLVLINLPAGDFMQGGDGLACHPQRQQDFKQALEQSLPYIAKLKPSVVNVLAGRQVAGFSRNACLEQLVANLTLTCEMLAIYPATVTCEPINNQDQVNYLTPSVADWLQLATQVQQPNFGLQLDLYHAACMGDSLQQLISEHSNDLAHIQFADYPNRSHPNTGQLPLMTVFQQLKQQGYKGWLAAEFPSAAADNYDWVSDICAITGH
ncbi:MAG TPA: TIM barrel protein [Marinospirillum sp.]|uniref:hydroxypyruvate isomerase family protein n=1 Tax=Marinospirillum sp. TaxID=2183934 RepID=UPI002B4A1009|nr:TIM barrel protein [Marinospirillum sp.]HKM16154.1 TIM barrel protein [Marinospirillum sp.]